MKRKACVPSAASAWRWEGRSGARREARPRQRSTSMNSPGPTVTRRPRSRTPMLAAQRVCRRAASGDRGRSPAGFCGSPRTHPAPRSRARRTARSMFGPLGARGASRSGSLFTFGEGEAPAQLAAGETRAADGGVDAPLGDEGGSWPARTGARGPISRRSGGRTGAGRSRSWPRYAGESVSGACRCERARIARGRPPVRRSSVRSERVGGRACR